MSAVTEFARLNGWLCYHPYDSRRSASGWPDLALCRPPRLVLAELKSGKGRVTAAQCHWLDALSGCSLVDAYLWRPADWAAIEAQLQRRAA